jgi:hypothetical protein
VVRPPPRSADLALDQERAGPDARCPEQLALLRRRDEQLPLRSVEEEVGVAARQQAGGAGRRGQRASRARRPRAATRRRAETSPVAAIPPATRMHGRRRAARSPPSARTGRPSWARRRGRSGEQARDMRRRVDLVGVDAPDNGCPCAFPTDGDRARRRGVPDRVAEPSAPATSRSVIRRPSRWACTCAAMRSARSRLLPGSGSPPLREEGEVALRDDVRAVARSPELGERRILPRRGSTSSMRACNESSAALGMLSCRPAHAARRSESGLFGDRSSSPPTRRRNARICCRVTSSRGATAPRVTLPSAGVRPPTRLAATRARHRQPGRRVQMSFRFSSVSTFDPTPAWLCEPGHRTPWGASTDGRGFRMRRGRLAATVVVALAAGVVVSAAAADPSGSKNNFTFPATCDGASVMLS